MALTALIAVLAFAFMALRALFAVMAFNVLVAFTAFVALAALALWTMIKQYSPINRVGGIVLAALRCSTRGGVPQNSDGGIILESFAKIGHLSASIPPVDTDLQK